jgi:hypothetical protein
VPGSYQVGRVNGEGNSVAVALGANIERTEAIVINLGPAPVWLGDRDALDPSSGKGFRVVPGESRAFTSTSPIYCVTWAGNTYVLETWDE